MKRKNIKDFSDILSIVSITIVAILLILLFKIKAGILGIVLGAITVATLFYWLKEIKKIWRDEKDYRSVKKALEKKKGETEWLYDLTDDEENITLTAEVPGPTEEVKVRLHKNVLEIRGGNNFIQKVKISKEVELQDRSYINGVLCVKLQKLKRLKFKKLSEKSISRKSKTNHENIEQ